MFKYEQRNPTFNFKASVALDFTKTNQYRIAKKTEDMLFHQINKFFKLVIRVKYS